ncbi:MAG: anti-sigma B factor antagonist [Gammaproteobacteria bacterium]|jgi:anti-sigma B factor antagonist
MNINTLEGEGYTIIGLEGDVDLSCSPDARKSILDVLQTNKNLLIDLGKVSYIDSSGVASLVEGYQTAKKQALKFGLVGVSDAAMSVLKLARLDKVFPIHDSVAEFEKEDA